ncbi:MAG: murein biosynthesis integral membrane protein MurJ [Myxococcota bacterium]
MTTRSHTTSQKKSFSGKKAGVLAKQTLNVSFFTAISRVFGLVRDTMIVHAFGASGVTDAFLVAFTIPNVMRRLVAEGALTVAMVPIYTQVLQQQGQQAAKKFFAAVVGLLTIGLSTFVVLSMLFAKQWVYLFAAGFSRNPAKLQLAADLTRWLFPYVLLISLVALFMGVLHSHKHFAAPAAAPIALNLCMIIACIFSRNIHILVGGVLVGGVLQLLLQIPFLAQKNLLVKPSTHWHIKPVKQLARMMLPALLGVATYQLNIVVLRQLASTLPDGHVSYYYFADRLTQLALGVFATAVATACLPAMSADTSRGSSNALFTTWLSSCQLTHFIVLPACLALGFLAQPIVSVLYGHGSFGQQDMLTTAAATVAFAPGLIAASLSQVTVQGFYAHQDMRTPVIISVVCMFANLALGWLLLDYGVAGLAGAVSISAWLRMILLLIFLHNKVPQLQFSTCFTLLLRPIIPATAAIFLAWNVASWGNWQVGTCMHNVTVLAVMVFVGAGTHFAIAHIAGFSEMRWIRHALLGTKRNLKKNPVE